MYLRLRFLVADPNWLGLKLEACMRDGHDMSTQRNHQHRHKARVSRPSRQDTSLPTRRLFTTKGHLSHRGDLKLPKAARQSCLPISNNQPYLSHSPLLWLSNPKTLPICHPVAALHSKAYIRRVQLDHAPQSIRPCDFQEDEQNKMLERFRSCIPRHFSGSGNVEAAWASFEELRTSNMLLNLPLDSLTQFAAWMYEISRIPPRNPMPQRDLKHEERLRRLHDAFRLRADNSVEPDLSTVRMWTSFLAVQILVLTGRLNKALQMVTASFTEGPIAPQHMLSLQQIFLASVRRHSFEDGLSILVKFWPSISHHLCVYQPKEQSEMDAASEGLRKSIAATLGTAEEAAVRLQNLKNTSLQEIGWSIFAFVYAVDWNANFPKMYRNLIFNRVPIPWDAQIRIFTASLSNGAYVDAYVMRKHILSAFPHVNAGEELSRIARAFPELATPNVLALKAASMAKSRLRTFVDSPDISQMDALSIWQDIESCDGFVRRLRSWNETELRDDELLAYARAIVEHSRAKPGDTDIHNAVESARVLDQVTDKLTRRSYARRGRGAEHARVPAFLWHSLTLKGQLSTVVDMLAKDVGGQWYPDFLRAVTQLFLAGLRLHTLEVAFGYLVTLWHVVVRHLDVGNARFKGKMAQESAELRQVVFTTFAAIDDPIAWVTNVPKTPEASNVATLIFFMLFNEQRDYDQAWRVFDDLQVQRLSVSYDAHLYLLKMLISGHAFDFANRVYHSIDVNFPQRAQTLELRSKDELHLGLNLSSLQGDYEHAEECFAAIKSRGLLTGGVRRRLLHAHAVGGDTERVHELFYQFFPANQAIPPSSKPTARDYREVIYAHVRAGDLQGINHWLDEMAQGNIPPDASIYNMILLAFAKSSDLESASAVLARMTENGVKPDRTSYTTVLSIMADRKDPVSAEQLYQRALDEGIVPDDVMTMSLMDAHVEAGSWRGVIRAFDYLQKSKKRSDRHTVHLYNTLLKAYVLIGAPFTVVSSVFRRFEGLKLTPTIHTYSLLIQSACDSGRMDVARNLFQRLDAMPLHGKAKTHIDAYVMTILMAGFLRNGEKEMARSVYDDMIDRGLQPRAVTFGVIIQFYANERSEEGLRIAEDFMQSLLAAEGSQRAWLGSAPGGRSKALEAVFGPLMSIYGRQLDAAAVETQFDKMIANGGQPTLVALTMLMDAYRRVDNLAGVQEIWKEIVQVAQRISQSDLFERLPSPTRPPSKPVDVPHRQANILCLPLSVYIDALSAAGHHVEIATTWRQVKDWGFSFDAHNWNHLAVALVRAGEVERAFELVERVLVPYQRQAHVSVRTRRKDPKSPLTFVGSDAGAPPPDPARSDGGEGEQAADGAEDAEEEDSSPRAPTRPPNRRMEAVDTSTKQQHWLSSLDDDAEADVAQPLHELQQMSVAWHAWRTHGATLRALGGALGRLGSGRRVRPVGGGVLQDEDPRRMSAGEAEAFYAREREEAEEILARVHGRYPNAVRLVERREMH
ncbi:hypothetical protein K439DRAFT_1504725 [Ramaria rubella]|nr:hypothetical protein K439DRAFT_1504725 [Ramaria rubella]